MQKIVIDVEDRYINFIIDLLSNLKQNIVKNITIVKEANTNEIVIVKYKNYTITRFKSGTIQATKNGKIASPTKPLLREIAQELDVDIENKNGNLYITRQLGVLLIRAIENKQEKNLMKSKK